MMRFRRIAMFYLALLPASVFAEAQDLAMGSSVERHLPGDEQFMQWTRDAERLATQQGDEMAMRDVVVPTPETIKLQNVVPPIHFDSGVAEVPDSTIANLRAALESVRDKQNVRLHLVGHADNQPLSARLARRYGDNEGLSRERAGQVAELFQKTLELPPEAMSFEWAGDSKPIAGNETAAGRAQNRRVEVEVWYDEMKDATVTEEVLVKNDIRQVKVCRVETVCKMRYLDGHQHRARVRNLVAPLHYDEASVDVTPEFVGQVQRTLEHLADKQHVMVKFIGYTDNTALASREERIYGDQETLSKARARRVALAIQEQLQLPTESVDSEGHGTDRALASNDTQQGRAMNRRVEVEFWYDDSLQELPDEPQMCPGDPGAELVTRVYDSPRGELKPVMLEQGSPVFPPGYLDKLKLALSDVADKTNARVRFVGYTKNEGLDRRTALVYGDDIGLSAARARRTMEAVAQELQLTGKQTEFEGRGYLYSDDVVNAGFVQGDTSYVAVQVVYDEPAILDKYEGVDITPLTRDLKEAEPLATNLMRITVDGKPIDDKLRSSEDVQRCTDVAMQDAGIQFTYDSLADGKRLNVAANTETVQLYTINPAVVVAGPVRFRMYSNYGHYIDHAEVRIFDANAATPSEPLTVIPVGEDSYAEWRPDTQAFAGPVKELEYALRAYDAEGHFDETVARPLWIHADASAAELYANAQPKPGTVAAAQGESVPAALSPVALSSFGENALATQNIPVTGGTVRVQGGGLLPNQQVWVAGSPVPADPSGRFVGETLMPAGVHTAEVAVLDDEGAGNLYLRDLKIEQNDWLYAGMADVTWSQNDASKNAKLYVGEDAPYDFGSSLDGRIAMFATGKFGEGWGLTTSIDTREDELSNLFTNFLSKQPDELFRRIDPDYHYPTFGDDGTVQQLTATEGKMYVKVNKGDSYGMWGNFDVGYMQNELVQVDRGLYGGDAHYQSNDQTSFGEKKLSADLFGAEPGTIPSRQDFRGTGGSLYFLRHQDILTGSERVRIEVRDKVTGIVTGVVNLSPADYEIDYLQGTVVLSEPLASTVDDRLLVRAGATGGDEAYLVVRYEYTPGFEDISAVSVGGQVHYWLNDYVQVGVTGNDNSQIQDESSLKGADTTLRLTSSTWIKVQSGVTEGLLTQSLTSNDGGFFFQDDADPSFVNADANAYRTDVSIGLQDISDKLKGTATLYGQTIDAGYAAPGLETLTDTNAYGGTFNIPLTEALSVRGKSDAIDQKDRIHAEADEVNLKYQLDRHWSISTGARYDSREDDSPIVLPTQQTGDRTDGVVQIGYDPRNAPWSAYSFAQDTLDKSGTREDNNRYGLGGSYLMTDHLKLDGEVSDGDLGGIGGKIGTTYLQSDRTSMYMNYVVEDERIDNQFTSTGGRQGSLVTGMKTRFTDTSSLFAEERYRNGNSLTGLTHAAGVRLAPAQGFNFSATTDIGTLRDLQTDAKTDRVAGSVRVGYAFETLQLSTGVEYRDDKSQQIDLTDTTLKTWLYRNTFRWQMTPSSRLLGKLDLSTSDSSLGDFFAGEYTEGTLGYAYRPVENDRLNMLVKYTYFYNEPTVGQRTSANAVADYIQKSHIGAIDVNYAVTSKWSVGGKYAYRFGEMSLSRDDPQYFDNSAALYVLRTDYRFREKWELMVEGRLLDMTDISEHSAGTLLTVSRYVGEHFKVGVGYNFTDFSDDLTHLDYDAKGFFLNLTGAL